MQTPINKTILKTMTIVKRMRKNDLQFYTNMRSKMVGNPQTKEGDCTPELIDTLLSNLKTDLRKISLDILVLLCFSQRKEVEEKKSKIITSIVECLSDKKEYLYVLRALRIFLGEEESEHSKIFLEILKEEHEEKLVKEEAFLFFYKNKSQVQLTEITPFLKSKSGLLVLTTKAVSTTESDVNLLVKKFRRVNLETKVVVLEGIKRIIESTNDISFFEKFARLFVKLIVRERKKSLLLLAKLAENNLEIQNKAHSLGLLSKLCDLVIEEHKNGKENASLYFCLYTLTGVSEENRKFLCKNPALPLIFHSLNTKTISRVFDCNFLALVYLFRSLTRSIHFIRSDLLDYPILDACVSALHSVKDIHKKRDVYDLIKEDTLSNYNLTEQVILLLSNLVLECGNFKSFFYQKKALRKTIHLVNFFPESTLFLLKNFIYDSCFAIKEYFLSETDESFFDKIIEKHFNNPKVVEQLLNLIRNLFCETELEIILKKYPSLIQTLFNQENFIYSLNDKVIEQYIYIHVNMSINKDCRGKIIERIDLNKLSKITKTRDLKVALAWLITNLTWKDYDDYSYNVEILHGKNVMDWLNSLDGNDPLLNEKVRSAYENLCK